MASTIRAIEQGEWWRVITSIFMHGDVSHFFWNLVALGTGIYLLCVLIKPQRTAIIFLISGICGNLVAISLFPGTYVGASGGIMGIMGAILSIYVVYRKVVDHVGVLWIVLTVMLTLLFGIGSGISNTAHITGLVVGALLGALLFTPPKPKRKRKTEIYSAPPPPKTITIPEAETITIYSTHSQNIKLLIAGLVFTLMCIGVIMLKEGDSFVLVMGIIGLCMSVPMMIIMPFEMVKRRKVLVIRPDGFEYRIGLGSIRFVPWGEVRSLDLWTIHGTSFICGTVKDRDKYLAGFTKRQKFMANLASGFPPIQISLATTKTLPEIALCQMNGYLNRYREHNPA